MTSLRGPNVAASVRQRLLNKARDTGRPFAELLQYFAMERFLYRLSKSEHAGNFVLKGALMFAAWQAPATRPTMDIDLLGITDNDLARLVGAVGDICLQDVESDGLVFEVGTIEAKRIVQDADYAGARVRFRGALGTARVSMQLDIGFGDVVVPEPRPAIYPTILDFPAPTIRGYSRESAVAEKFEAMVKLGTLNSRLKDFFDIWSLSRRFDFDGSTLAEAVTQTFAHRGTTLSAEPVGLTEEFGTDGRRRTQWRAFLRKNRIEDIPDDFAEVVQAVAVFLGPVARELAAGNQFKGQWGAPGPWR